MPTSALKKKKKKNRPKLIKPNKHKRGEAIAEMVEKQEVRQVTSLHRKIRKTLTLISEKLCPERGL